jgi:hypothetical protein
MTWNGEGLAVMGRLLVDGRVRDFVEYRASLVKVRSAFAYGISPRLP